MENLNSQDTDLNADLPQVDELAVLKSRADLMGVSYHPSISLAKLRDKINAAVTAEGKPDTDDAAEGDAQPVEVPAETIAQRRLRKKRDALALIRIRVTCMNPAKKEWDGEIFTAGNSLIGSTKKYVPFNNDEGWHVPRIILNQIQQRQCQIFVTAKDARGNSVRKGKLIKEFAVEIMPMLTPEELHDLAQKQAMAKSID